jgi:hypothetical protein
VTSKTTRKRRKGGFHPLSFDAGFAAAVSVEEIRQELSGPLPPHEREEKRSALRSLENKITPAARQSSAPFERMVRSEAAAWSKQHGGMPNISDFIRHFQSLACARRLRWTADKLTPATDDAIRKILRNAGFSGSRGRQRNGP